MEMRFLPDEAIEAAGADLLEIGSAAAVIESSIRNTGTPFVYGVLGDWGSGKTSMLHLLRNSLKERAPGFVTIWFNAWQYENEQNMVYPLLYAIKRQYDQDPRTHAADAGFKKSFWKVLAGSALAM